MEDLPLVAMMPMHGEFDDEANAATKCGLPVLRFGFQEEPYFEEESVPRPCRAIHRGFMLSGERYRQLYEWMQVHGVHMIVSPEDCSRAHYYPDAYKAIRSISPRACWVEIADPKTVNEAQFAEMLQEVKGWGCDAVLLKDFVKSAKAQTRRFMRITDLDMLPELCCDLVHVRGACFNRGVVAKEHVHMVYYQNRGDVVTNEYRMFFGKGALLEPPQTNSHQEGVETDQPPPDIVEAATRAARELGSPYVTVDVAEGEKGWFCLEAGDGGFSGPATGQDLEAHWAGLSDCFL